MVAQANRTIFGILMDVVATADVLVEQLEYIKRHPEFKDQRRQELEDMLMDTRTRDLHPDFTVPPELCREPCQGHDIIEAPDGTLITL